MNREPNIQNSPGGGNAIVQVFRFLLRRTLTAILVLTLASLIWFGWQQLDRWMYRMSQRAVLLETDAESAAKSSRLVAKLLYSKTCNIDVI